MGKPDFFIVGAPKCGTTAMQQYLSKHPDIYMPEKKEPHFFGSDLDSTWFIRDRESYEALFTPAREESRVGEASVWYLYSSEAAAEIKRFNPEAQAIIMLRNPVDMMYSNHSQFLYNGNEDLPNFACALEAEVIRKKGQRIPPDAHFVKGLFYRETARYTKQVERYVEAFGWDDLHVIVYDDLKQDTAKSYQDLLRFLDVEIISLPKFETVNSNKRARSATLRKTIQSPPKSLHVMVTAVLPRRTRKRTIEFLKRFNTRHETRTSMDAGLRRRLQQEFAHEVGQLSALLGRDFTHWSID